MSVSVLGKLRSESSPMVTSIHCKRFVQSVSYSTFMFSVSITCPRSCMGKEGGEGEGRGGEVEDKGEGRKGEGRGGGR